MDEQVMTQLLAARTQALAAARAITRCRHDAEDCVQTALQLAVEQGAGCRPVNPTGWLVTVARRRAIDVVRRRDAQARAISRHADSPVERDIAENVVDSAEADWLAREARTRLPRSTQAVLDLLVTGRSIRETALELGLSERSVEGHVHRLRTTLRRAWAASLGAVAVLASGFRKLLPAAAPALAVAMVLAIGVVAPARPAVPPARGVSPTTEDAAAGWRADQFVAGSSPQHEQVQPTSANPARQAGGAVSSSPRDKRVLHEQDATGQTDATVKDRGGPDDPVFGTLKCVQEFEISPSHVGC